MVRTHPGSPCPLVDLFQTKPLTPLVENSTFKMCFTWKYAKIENRKQIENNIKLLEEGEFLRWRGSAGAIYYYIVFEYILNALNTCSALSSQTRCHVFLPSSWVHLRSTTNLFWTLVIFRKDFQCECNSLLFLGASPGKAQLVKSLSHSQHRLHRRLTGPWLMNTAVYCSPSSGFRKTAYSRIWPRAEKHHMFYCMIHRWLVFD